MKYFSIASGSKGNCFVLQTKQTTLVIDCGSTKKHLVESFDTIGLQINQVDALLITHTHQDHIKQLKLFKDVATYAPIELDTPMFQLIVEMVPFVINDCLITPIGLSHDDEEVVGYIIKSEDQKFVYITDTGYLKDSYLSIIHDADFYVIESNHDPELLMKLPRPYQIKARILSDNGHLCNDDSATILSKVVTEKTKEIVLAHLSSEANTHDLALTTVARVLQKVGRTPIIKTAKQFEIVMGGSS